MFFCVDVNLNDRTERGQYPCSYLDRKRTYYMARKTTFSCGNTEGNPGKLRHQTPAKHPIRSSFPAFLAILGFFVSLAASSGNSSKITARLMKKRNNKPKLVMIVLDMDYLKD